MKRYALAILFLVAWHAPRSAHATTWTTSDCEEGTVQKLHDSASVVDGDTIKIKAGTCSWTTVVTIKKAITLRGENDCALDEHGKPTLAGCSTIIQDNVDNYMLQLFCTANKPLRVAHFRVDPGSVRAGVMAAVTCTNTGAETFRIDHIYGNDSHSIFVFVLNALGVADHNVMTSTTAAIFFYIYADEWKGFHNANGSFADRPRLDGSFGDCFYLEDNSFLRTGTFYAVTDAYRGARYCARHNSVLNGWWEAHGSEGGDGIKRGTRFMEVYENVHTCDVFGSYLMNLRSSASDRFWNNTVTGCTTSIIALNTYHAFSPFVPWGGADGRNPINHNGTPAQETGTATGGTVIQLIDTGKTWTANQWTGKTLRRTNRGCESADSFNVYCFSLITSSTACPGSCTITVMDAGQSPQNAPCFVMSSGATTAGATLPLSSEPSCSNGSTVYQPLGYFRPGETARILVSGVACYRTITAATATTVTWAPACSGVPNGTTDTIEPWDIAFNSGDTYEINQSLTNFDQTGVAQGTRLLAYAISGCRSSGFTATCTVPAMPASWATNDYVAIGSVGLTSGVMPATSAYQGLHKITKVNSTTITFATSFANLANGDNNGTATKIPATFDEVAEPIVKWNNKNNGVEIDYSVPYPQIRQYEHYASAQTGTSLPATCTAGHDWYWLTNVSQLHYCDATNHWTLNYVPAPYPHPLQGATPPTPRIALRIVLRESLGFSWDSFANETSTRFVFPAMRKLLFLALLGVAALVAYNYNAGRDLFQLPGTSAAALKDTVRETVRDTVRDGVRSAARETSAEVKARASAGVHAAKNRAEEALTAAALTSKIKAKMALDDVVKASDIDVDTEGSVVTLTGDVGSADERQRAVRIATETAGVTKVVTHLNVR